MWAVGRHPCAVNGEHVAVTGVVLGIAPVEDLHLDGPYERLTTGSDRVAPDEHPCVAERLEVLVFELEDESWYIRAVRSSQIGLPVLWIMPSRTLHVSGAQLTFAQPSRSRPLKSGTNPVSSCGDQAAIKTTSAPAAIVLTIGRIVADQGSGNGGLRAQGSRLRQNLREGGPTLLLEP